jgi:transposase-like protein
MIAGYQGTQVVGAHDFSPEDERRIVAVYLAGDSLHKIAVREGSYVEAVRKVLIRRSVERRPQAQTLLSAEGEAEVVKQYLSGASLSDLARQYRCSSAGIGKILRRRDVPRRRRGNPGYQLTPEQDAQIVQGYEDGESIEQVAPRFGVNTRYVSRTLCAAGVKLRRVGAAAAGFDRCGGRIMVQGYVCVLVPRDSPFASMRREPMGYVPEHRLVMAEALGRPLRSTETVHHLDGDKTNNSPDNLELHHGVHGRGVRMRCACCGSYDVETY